MLPQAGEERVAVQHKGAARDLKIVAIFPYLDRTIGQVAETDIDDALLALGIGETPPVFPAGSNPGLPWSSTTPGATSPSGAAGFGAVGGGAAGGADPAAGAAAGSRWSIDIR